MTSDAFIRIVGAVITVLITLIAIYIIPAIKSAMSEKDLETIIEVISIAVRCADQVIPKEEYERKKAFVKQYVINFCSQHFNVKLTEEQIDTLIEGAVNEIHQNGVR